MTTTQPYDANGGRVQDDEPDDGACPDCLPHSMCLACADDERFHAERDMRLEDDE